METDMLMQPIMRLLVIVVGLGAFMLFAGFAIISWREHERRAAGRALLLAIMAPLPYLLAGLLPIPFQFQLNLGLILMTLIGSAILFMPFGQRAAWKADTPHMRVDERDIMFARNRLQPGSERFEAYYQRHPDRQAMDDKFRLKPGLMSPGAAYFDPVAFAAAEASFATVAAFHPLLDRKPPAQSQIPVQPAQMTKFIKTWGKKLGAVSLGVTELQDYHLYSHIGRGEPYGAPIEREHTYAIALTVEMDKVAMDSAPYAPAVMESAQQYLEAGAIAVQLAEFIHALGYPARAHIDGSYRVICPLVGRDAGLGEIGRMGLLMTPELGPRVRLAVVTTDLPLVPDERRKDASLLDFCRRCKKCAETCPSKAIAFDDRREIDGAWRWKINSEACFTYWCTIGTDCGRCMQVCPYSHPDNLAHNLIRTGVRRSATFRALALKMDDYFYGRKPSPQPIPQWISSVSLRNK
ncbi:MAG: 4Fe-4S dicluster domain-containing protein [Lysobacterales bacterium]|nr:MAG: 4Fe-4S dicluster domain-containing protein [Xanthomonadales bacterium]